MEPHSGPDSDHRSVPLQEVIEEQVQVTWITWLILGVNWVWMPPWGLERITEDGRDMMRAGLQHLSSTADKVPPGGEHAFGTGGTSIDIRYVSSGCLF